MKLLLTMYFALLLSAQSMLVVAQQSGDLARKYCKSHSCESINVVEDIIKNPTLGACILISKKTRLSDLKVTYSSTNWWLLIHNSLSGKEFDQVIEIAKVFSGATGMQTFLAEPVKEVLNEAQAAYCTALFDLTKGVPSFGILIPKF
jgi:hypothetical protein